MEKVRCNSYQIEMRTGVHRQVINRFMKEEYNGISYENGMALRTYLQQQMKSATNNV